MKKLFIAMCMMLASATSFAQTDKGDVSFGAHFNYMIDSPHNLGLGANIGYMLMDHVRGVGEFDYYFKKDGVSCWNVEANLEYLFHLGDSFTIYPLAGLNLMGWTGDGTDTRLGVDLGAGVEYPITSNFSLKGEYVYKTQGSGWSILRAGVVLHF
jgi:opacity protein-like surface antigen